MNKKKEFHLPKLKINYQNGITSPMCFSFMWTSSLSSTNKKVTTIQIEVQKEMLHTVQSARISSNHTFNIQKSTPFSAIIDHKGHQYWLLYTEFIDVKN
jgi:hypothetical protein